MKSYYCALAFAVLIYLVSCSNPSIKQETAVINKQYTLLEKMSWIKGKWINKSEQGTNTEIWQSLDDSTLSGESFFIIGKDTVSHEILSLEQRGEQLFYIPTVQNQNNGKPVVFTMSSNNDNSIGFENLKHDFPQRIVYTKINNDSCVAEISGKINGTENKMQFPLKRSE